LFEGLKRKNGVAMYEKIKFFVDYDNREAEECYVASLEIRKLLLLLLT